MRRGGFDSYRALHLFNKIAVPKMDGICHCGDFAREPLERSVTPRTYWGMRMGAAIRKFSTVLVLPKPGRLRALLNSYSAGSSPIPW